MKITKSQLKQIIKEELDTLVEYVPPDSSDTRSDSEDFSEYELDDMSTDYQMVHYLKEILAQLKTLNQSTTPAKTRGQSDLERSLAQLTVAEGNKAAKTVGDPPYRERGSTESQAQQKAAGMALSARRGDTPVSKLKGAALDLYKGEISTKDLRNLAKLGQNVKQHKAKEPKHLKSLPGHVTPAKD